MEGCKVSFEKKVHKSGSHRLGGFVQQKPCKKQRSRCLSTPYAKRPLRSLLLMIEVFNRNSPSLCHDFHVSRKEKKNIYICIWANCYNFRKPESFRHFRGGTLPLESLPFGEGNSHHFPDLSFLQKRLHGRNECPWKKLGRFNRPSVWRERLGSPTSWKSCGAKLGIRHGIC